jgi:hypothetical protein
VTPRKEVMLGTILLIISAFNIYNIARIHEQYTHLSSILNEIGVMYRVEIGQEVSALSRTLFLLSFVEIVFIALGLSLVLLGTVRLTTMTAILGLVFLLFTV